MDDRHGCLGAFAESKRDGTGNVLSIYLSNSRRATLAGRLALHAVTGDT